MERREAVRVEARSAEAVERGHRELKVMWVVGWLLEDRIGGVHTYTNSTALGSGGRGWHVKVQFSEGLIFVLLESLLM